MAHRRARPDKRRHPGVCAAAAVAALIVAVLEAPAASTTAGTAAAGAAPIGPSPVGAQATDDGPLRVVTVAGTGSPGDSGDGGPALDAEVSASLALDVDGDGNVYAVDTAYGSVRRIGTDGVIDAVARPDGPTADGTVLDADVLAQAVAVDAGGLVLATTQDVRRVDAGGGVSVIAGNGDDAPTRSEPGDGGPATATGVAFTDDVAVDAAGNVYVADAHNDRIRRIDAAGTITTVAGGGANDPRGAEGRLGTDVRLDDPSSVAVDSQGVTYFTNGVDDDSVYRLGTDGTLATLAGHNPPGFPTDGPVADAVVSARIRGVAVDADDNLYVVDAGNGVVRRIAPDDTVTTLNAWVPDASDIAVGPDGDLYLAADGRVLRIERGGAAVLDDADDPDDPDDPDAPADPRWRDEEPGALVLVAGPESGGTTTDDPRTQPGSATTGAPLDEVGSLAVDAGGTVYVAGEAPFGGTLSAIDADAAVTTVVGDPRGEAIGQATDMAPTEDGALVFHARGQIYRMDPDGLVTSIAGRLDRPPDGAPVDGSTAVTVSMTVVGLAVGSDGEVYVADQSRNAVLRIGADGRVATAVDGADAGIGAMGRIAVDDDGGVLVVEPGQTGRVHRVDPDGDGDATPVAGDQVDNSSPIDTNAAGVDFSEPDAGPPDDGDGGPATEATLRSPYDVAVDGGNVYVSEGIGRIRRIDADGRITTIADRLPGADPLTAPSVTLQAVPLAVDAHGDLFVGTSETEQVHVVVAAAEIEPASDAVDDRRSSSGATVIVLAVAAAAVLGVVVVRRRAEARRVEAR
jgi:hypothetical protein